MFLEEKKKEGKRRAAGQEKNRRRKNGKISSKMEDNGKKPTVLRKDGKTKQATSVQKPTEMGKNCQSNGPRGRDERKGATQKGKIGGSAEKVNVGRLKGSVDEKREGQTASRGEDQKEKNQKRSKGLLLPDAGRKQDHSKKVKRKRREPRGKRKKKAEGGKKHPRGTSTVTARNSHSEGTGKRGKT